MYLTVTHLCFYKDDHKKLPSNFMNIWCDYITRTKNIQIIDYVDSEKYKDTTAVIYIESSFKRIPFTYGIDESYRLNIKRTIYTLGAASITISCVNQYSIMNALKTLFMLLEYEPEQSDENNLSKLQCVIKEDVIYDIPEYSWRGLLVDPARHFIPIDTLQCIIRIMCLLKMNVLHLHLTDDQGFCFESKFASENYYTSKSLKQLVQYALELGIRIVPEINIPGHVSQMIYKCPRLATKTTVNQPETRNTLQKPVLNVVDDYIMEELIILLNDVMDVFPDSYIHLGGGEVDTTDWKGSKKITKYMKQINCKGDYKMLQIDFMKRVYDLILKQRGKILVCWEDLYHAKLYDIFSPSELILQRWKFDENAIMVTEKTGFNGLRTVIDSRGALLNRLYPAKYYYCNTFLDSTSKDKNTLDSVYVTGGEACLWGNFLSDDNIMSTLIPNLFPVAERLWGGNKGNCNLSEMYQRLDKFDKLMLLLEPKIEIGHHSALLPDICKCFESIWGGFSKDHPRNSFDRLTGDPMNELCDLVLPESKFARHLYDTTVKMIDATINEQDNPYFEMLMHAYHKIVSMTKAFPDQLKKFNNRLQNNLPVGQQKHRRRSLSSPRGSPRASPRDTSQDNTSSPPRSMGRGSIVSPRVLSGSSTLPRSIGRKSPSQPIAIIPDSPIRLYRANTLPVGSNEWVYDQTTINSVINSGESRRRSIDSSNYGTGNASIGTSGSYSSPVKKKAHFQCEENWSIVEKTQVLCKYAVNVLSLFSNLSFNVIEYERMLNEINEIHSTFYQKMHIAICPAVKLLIEFKLNPKMIIPLIPESLDKTSENH